MSSQRPFAVFDIDGTLIRWQLYHAVLDALYKNGAINDSAFQTVRSARMEWKRRSSPMAYSDYEHQVVRVFETALTSLSERQLNNAMQTVITEYGQQTYLYTRNLLTDLKQQGYLTFAVSASQHQIVGMLAEQYGFDDFGGSSYEIINGRFTGKNQALRRERKPVYMQQLVARHNATYAKSFGIGDSDSDIPMLEAVAQPIAFNPNKPLFEHAKAKGWQIVIERKNMIYELRKHDEQYILV